jgi:hypothetical protein
MVLAGVEEGPAEVIEPPEAETVSQQIVAAASDASSRRGPMASTESPHRTEPSRCRVKRPYVSMQSPKPARI